MNTKMKWGIGIAAAVVGIYLLTRKKTATVSMVKSTDANTAGFSTGGGQTGQHVVGQYNATTNQTFCFPYGNTAAGYFVQGRINLPMGSLFYPA